MTNTGKRTLKVGITVGLSLGAIVGLVGCSEQQDAVDAPSHDFALGAMNGLAAINGLSAANGLQVANGLTAANGLASSNGLSAANGLASSNGLSAANGLMTTDGGRRTISYLVKCALAAGDTLVKQDQYGASYTFAGGLGLCTSWKYGSVANSAQCQLDVSACMMAHVNTAGIHIPIWLDSTNSQIGWGVDRANYPMQEGTFFGNIITTGNLSSMGMPTVTAPAGFYCDGAGFPAGANGIVAGRLGANQAGSPYLNPFGTSRTVCQGNGGSVGQYSQGTTGSCPVNVNGVPDCPDGYKAITASSFTFNSAITVWRSNTYVPQFDAGYTYRMMPVDGYGGLSVDVAYASQTNGTMVQQWGSWNGDPQKFNILPSGSSWKITMKANNAKCLDLSGGGSGLGDATKIVIWDCDGSSSQSWNITPDASTGAFVFQNAQSGRCLDQNNASTAAGLQMQIWDCNGSVNQKFQVQAYPQN